METTTKELRKQQEIGFHAIERSEKMKPDEDGRVVFDEYRLRQLAKPKKRADAPVSSAERERRGQRELEMESRRQRYKKFDFANFLDRDAEPKKAAKRDWTD